MNEKIFVISAHTEDGSKSRTFGWFPELNDAVQAVMANVGGMEEALYTWLTIEEVPSGVHAAARVVQWFKWHASQHWLVELNKPVWAENVINLCGVG